MIFDSEIEVENNMPPKPPPNPATMYQEFKKKVRHWDEDYEIAVELGARLPRAFMDELTDSYESIVTLCRSIHIQGLETNPAVLIKDLTQGREKVKFEWDGLLFDFQKRAANDAVVPLVHDVRNSEEETEEAVTEEPVVALGQEKFPTEESEDKTPIESIVDVKNDDVVGDDDKNNTNKKGEATTEVKEEPEDENFFDVPPVVEIEHGLGDVVEKDETQSMESREDQAKEEPEDETFFDVHPVKVELGLGVEVEDSTWTQVAVKKEPEDENFFDVPPVKVEHDHGQGVEDSIWTQVEVKKEPEDENFFDVPPVKVEDGQGVQVEDHSTWTQENYFDYYDYADEEMVELFPFEPGEVEETSDLVHAIKPTIAANPGDVFRNISNQIKSQEPSQDADEIKNKTTNDVFHKSPDELVLIKTEEAEDHKLNAEFSDPLAGAKGEDKVKEIHQQYFDLIEAAKLFDPGITDENNSDAEVSDEESNNSEKQIEPDEEFFDEQNNLKKNQVVNIQETGTTNDDENDVEEPNSESDDRCLPATNTGRIGWKPKKLYLQKIILRKCQTQGPSQSF